MTFKPVIISLPIIDRQMSYNFYRDGLGLEPIGEPAEDGIPEPLQFSVNEGLHLMLIPIDGFQWVIGENKVAKRGHIECLFSIMADSVPDVNKIVRRAAEAGGKMISEPAQQDWGYTATFSDPDGHLWMVELQT